MRKEILAEGAPRVIGPYSQAIRVGDLIWVSGQIALDPKSGSITSGGIEEQTRQALANLAAILREAGSSFDRVVKTTVFLTNLEEFEGMNRVYAQTFSPPYPARVCVEVSRLPRGSRVEVDAIALAAGRT